MPNVREVAQWIGATEGRTFAFDDSYRPVPLKADVFGYNPGKNKFVDKYIRLYKAVSLIEPHLAGGQALIFVATRSDTSQAASKLVEIFATKRARLATQESEQVAARIKNKSLGDAVRNGIGFHHAGLVKQDRDLIEEAFKAGHIKILVSTSTLAWGVNLPARVVVIRDIANEAIDEETSSLDLLQMLGRAGRPQYDERGFGWIIAPRDRAQEFVQMLQAGPPIRSQLHTTLSEHLNAEISMGTIKSREDAQQWFSGTFYYVQHPESSVLLDDHVNALIEKGFAVEAQDNLLPTDLGTLASKYYLRLDTARGFKQLREGPSDEELLNAVASAEEFISVVVRRNELSAIKGAQAHYTGPKSKIYAILKAYIERGEVPEVLRSDAWLIRQNALRLLSALEAFLLRFNAPETVLRAKILALRLEYGAPEKLCPLLQLDGVGIKQATQLYAQGIRSPFDITGTMLSRLVAGSRIAQSISKLPEIVIDMQLPDSIAFGQGLMCHATLANARGGARVSVTVFANGLKMLRDSFYLANGYTKSIPIGTYGSQNERVTYQVRVDHLDCVEAPQIREKVIMIDGLPNELSAATSNAGKRLITTDNGTRDQTEVPRFSIPPGALETPLTTPHHGSRRENTKPDEGVLDVRSRSVGRCKQCGGSLNRAGSAITCDCGAVYKLPSGAELTESTCSCGLPKFRLKLLDVDVCIDRRCESMDDVISKHFATSNFICPRCQGPLTIVRRKGIIVGCAQYYDGCKTAFLLPANATIVGRCECGLPKLQLKTKTRCLDTACRA
jgi:hypothetical protein